MSTEWLLSISAAYHGVAKSQTWLSDFTFTFHFHAPEEEMATHSSVPAWRIPGTAGPSGLPSMGSHRVGHHWRDLAVAAVVYVCVCVLFFLWNKELTPMIMEVEKSHRLQSPGYRTRRAMVLLQSENQQVGDPIREDPVFQFQGKARQWLISQWKRLSDKNFSYSAFWFYSGLV